MIFCLGGGRWKGSGEGYQKNLRIFNKDVSEEEYQKVRKLLTENEIEVQLIGKKYGGLKVYSYEDAWRTFWNNASKTQKDCILNIEQFDSEIFKKITGIDASKEDNKKQELLSKADELIKKAYDEGHNQGILDGTKSAQEGDKQTRKMIEIDIDKAKREAREECLEIIGEYDNGAGDILASNNSDIFIIIDRITNLNRASDSPMEEE